ncbi:hypothetical protein ACRAWD_25745 [Caulobacter segnis]
MPAAPDYPSAPDLVAPKRALLGLRQDRPEAAQVLHAAGGPSWSRPAAPRPRSPRPRIPVKDRLGPDGLPR